MDFTPEQREYIDEQLKLCDEMQLKNGNELMPFEEFMDELLENIDEEINNYRIQNL